MKPWWTSTSDRRRFILAQRKDGLRIAVEMEGDKTCFTALLPNNPVGHRVLLRGADTLTTAMAQVDERWAPSPWMTEKEEHDLDFVDCGDGTKIPLYIAEPGKSRYQPPQQGDPTVFTHRDYAPRGFGAPPEKTRLSLSTMQYGYAHYRLVGLAIQINGEGQVVSNEFNVGGGMCLIDGAITLLSTIADGTICKIIENLRDYPLIRHNQLFLEMEVSGSVTVEVSAIVRRVFDEGALPARQDS